MTKKAKTFDESYRAQAPKKLVASMDALAMRAPAKPATKAKAKAKAKAGANRALPAAKKRRT